MVKTFKMKLNSIQPSQLYVSSEKLDNVMRNIDQTKPVIIEPIPVKKLGDEVIFVDGHTRAFAAFLLGISEIPVYWEDEKLDWKEYMICVEWYKKEGINSI